MTPDGGGGSNIEAIPIEKIVVRGRYRKDFGDLSALADSIQRLGLLQPIGINRDHQLLWGERRLRAFQYLGYAEIPARVLEINDILAVEHDENEMRKAFTITERAEIFKALKSRHGGDRKSDQVQNFALDIKSAAKKSGFGNRQTANDAEKILDRGTPELKEAVNQGEIAVSTAAALAGMAAEEQTKITSISDVKKKKAAAARTVKARNSKKRADSSEAKNVKSGLGPEDSLFIERSLKALNEMRSILGTRDPVECGEWLNDCLREHHYGRLNPALNDCYRFLETVYRAQRGGKVIGIGDQA